jgi:hypothetical protein
VPGLPLIIFSSSRFLHMAFVAKGRCYHYCRTGFTRLACDFLLLLAPNIAKVDARENGFCAAKLKVSSRFAKLKCRRRKAPGLTFF